MILTNLKITCPKCNNSISIVNSDNLFGLRGDDKSPYCINPHRYLGDHWCDGSYMEVWFETVSTTNKPERLLK